MTLIRSWCFIIYSGQCFSTCYVTDGCTGSSYNSSSGQCGLINQANYTLVADINSTIYVPQGQCTCIILVTPCSMVWDWRVSRAGPMPLYWPSCSLTFCLLLFSLSLLSFYGLVLWGWGLRTDRVLIALSQPCIANLF